jgi:hypothetical protein
MVWISGNLTILLDMKRVCLYYSRALLEMPGCNQVPETVRENEPHRSSESGKNKAYLTFRLFQPKIQDYLDL